METTNEIDYRYMSDEDISQQYSGMRILEFSGLRPNRFSGWWGYFDVDLPNADGVQFDTGRCVNFDVYDNGNSIGFDVWLPTEQEEQLKQLIRQELSKL